MRRPIIAAIVVLVLASAGGITWMVIERHNRSVLVKQSERPCGPLITAATGLPLGLPTTGDATVLSVTTQGKTTIAFARLAGGRGDIVAVRDRVLNDLKGAGYTVTGTDQEPGYEAEAQLGGSHSGTIKVSPLCTGQLQIRYKIEQ